MKTERLSIGGREYNAAFIRGRRKSISLKVLSAKDIEVKYPAVIGKDKAVEFIMSKGRWLENKSRLFDAAETAGAGSGIYAGRILYYHGREYTVAFKDNGIEFSGDKVFIPEGCRAECMEAWYKMQTESAVGLFLEKYGHSLPAFSIKVKKQKRRWGSCTSQGNIYINSRLSMCPPEVIEYIIWHEICHLAHMNHSQDFYRLLHSKCPDYKKHRAWLKSRQMFLDI